ncbi:MAG TPA: carbohydrate ABC transporter permease [Acholeplasmataceae bacterium]|jgi:multiple sugar transport system permease protein|nr:carbohydrate ABC transporter permease [Acholeplasmataceae bacterium]
MINPERFHKSQIKFYLILLPILLVMMLPIVFIISHAFKPLDELYAYPPKFFPSRLTLDNFKQLIKATSQTGVPFSRYLFNSILVAILVILFSLLFGSLAAFAFSFLEFKGKKVIFGANQIAIMFVAVAVAVPRYIVMSRLGIINSFFAHIIPLIAIPVGVFLLKQFMDQIPRELYDAAKIDGANKLQIYFRVILPLVKPALATIAILAFQSAWNNTETSQLFINDEALKTLPYYFGSLTLGTSSIAAQGISAAASLIIFLPNIVLFIILQRNVMNTMAHSGLK